jgi:cullin 3
MTLTYHRSHAILLLFENLGEKEFLTYKEIKDATAIPDSELQRNLQSLACTTFRVFRKHPAGRDVNREDSFSPNEDFSSVPTTENQN